MAAPLFFTVTIFALVFVVLAAFVSIYLVKSWKENRLARDHQLQKLEKSENKYTSLFNNVSDIVFIHTLDGIVEEVNLTVTKELGYIPEEVIGKSMLEFVTPENNPLLGNYLEGVQRLGEFSGLVQIRSKNGTHKVFDYRNTLVKEDDKPVAVRGIARNVTEREKTRAALQESEERYRLFFEQDLTGDFIATVKGNILSCNPAFASMFGFDTVDEALEQSFASLYPSPQSFQAFLDLLNKKENLQYYEDQLIDKHGNTVYIIENAIGIFDDDGKLTGIRGYIFNNTERKHLETQLLHFQKMQGIGTLAGGVAHDFNNILSIIKGHATLMQTGKIDKTVDLNSSVQSIHQAVDRGAQLVEQILTFARKADIDFKAVNVGSVIQEIVSLLSGTFPRTIDFNLKLTDSYFIRADQGQIHQALLNLCINARDAMQTGGTITISTRLVNGEQLKLKYPDAQAETYVVIDVADNGTGMDEQTRERLFEPFYSTKQRNQGTGLGLSVVYGIISSHFGFVEVESEPGNGTTFSLYFPQTQNEVEVVDENESIAEKPILGNETILIVEDEEMLVDLLSATFEDSGYSILVARDGLEAISTYQKNIGKIDLIFSDSGLPRLNGWEAFNRIRQIDPGARAVFASGFFEPEVRSQMIDNGVEKIIQKPYSPLDILKTVREILDKKTTR